MGLRQSVLTIALVVTSVATTSAAAAGKASIALHVPASVKAGSTVVIHESGFAPRHEELATIIDTRPCARTLAKEVARSNVIGTSFHVNGRFHKHSDVTHAAAGLHHVCAYLSPRGSSIRTLARATAHYTAH